nr:N-6 DNA methylase [Actinomycetota bacterium]
MSNRVLDQYLRSLHDDYASGEAAVEVSGYGALQTLLNSAGSELNPSVRVVINPKNRGAGTPDGGLFTSDQFRRELRETGVWPTQLPGRGAVEVKGPKEDVDEIASGEQVKRYLNTYSQVLVTNYRDFKLVGQDEDDNVTELERFTLATTETEFWRLAGRRARDGGTEARFREFLIRTLAYGAPLRRAEDLAWFLASYARESLLRLESGGSGARELRLVREALEQALGMGFKDEEGEHFFRSTLVQTLFYGVFSAWVLWSKRTPFNSSEKFNWRLAADTLNVPLIRSLFEQLTLRATMKALGIQGIMDRTGELLNRVERKAFFEDFEEDGAVQYFYEPFLQAFDPELRKQLGVWYTPKEVVRYMVERVDQALKDELDIPDGLADESVYILDPCCGTGAYLIEVISRIDKSLRESGGDALVAQDLKKAAAERVFGFEILPAPFVVAHLQLGLLLQNLGSPLSDRSEERASVYLTNALTGWEPRDEAKRSLQLIEFEEEREAADEIKQRKPVLVVLGNPPYYPYSGVGVEEEKALVSTYRTTQKGPKPEGQGLNDLYVRFFRIAERQIVEESQRGIICYISNYSWLDGRSHPGMRERYVNAFDGIWVDRLNGDSRKNGKVAPDGTPDP